MTKEGILAAWAICVDGQRVLLHLALGSTESHDNWLEFLRDMSRRGLRVPLSITSDGASGLMTAIEQMWPKSLRIRCWANKCRNILDKVPKAAQSEVKAFLTSVREAPTLEAGQSAAELFCQRFEREYPSAVRSFRDDLEASLTHLRLPAAHRRYVRTTNLIERSFLKERRRTKTLPRFFDEKSAMKLIYSTLERATRRWRRLIVSDLERTQLKQLRNALGLDPDPSPERNNERDDENSPHAA